jgi:hypothetical protein
MVISERWPKLMLVFYRLTGEQEVIGITQRRIVQSPQAVRQILRRKQMSGSGQ